MPARSFLDTNVLLYADDKAAPAKQGRALALVDEHRRAGTGVVSIQVLQEYFVSVTRKLRVDAAIARRKVELLAEFDVVAPKVADILAAIDQASVSWLFFLGCASDPYRCAGRLQGTALGGYAGSPRDRWYADR
jgi:predicted nucleic acid-binding protein